MANVICLQTSVWQPHNKKVEMKEAMSAVTAKKGVMAEVVAVMEEAEAEAEEVAAEAEKDVDVKRKINIEGRGRETGDHSRLT